MSMNLIKTYQNLANTDIPSASLLKDLDSGSYILKVFNAQDNSNGLIGPYLVANMIYPANTEILTIDAVVQNYLTNGQL